MAQWSNDGLHESAGVIHSFLLAGQSNMAGRGDLTPDTALTAPGCLMLRMGRWQPMSEPVNVDRAVLEGACPRSGASLAASFAARYAAESVCQAGLIPCADGAPPSSSGSREGCFSTMPCCRRNLLPAPPP